MSRIVIIGGHGKVARLLTPRLAAAGHTITAVVRNPAQQADVAADGAIPLVFDIEQAERRSIETAIEGHDVVVWSAGAGGGNPARTYAIDRDAAVRTMEAAERLHIDRFVMVSYLRSGLESGLDPGHSFYPYAQAKAEADAHLRQSKLAWTILGPGALTLEPASGAIRLNPEPFPAGAASATSRANTALVIAAAIEADKTIGKTYRFIDGDTPIATALLGRSSPSSP